MTPVHKMVSIPVPIKPNTGATKNAAAPRVKPIIAPRKRTVHLASVVDGDANLDSGVHVTLDDFLREWSIDPHPKYVTPKYQESGPQGDDATTTAQADGSTAPSGKGRAFQCPICGDRYVSSRSLRRHLSRRSFLARLPCRKCGSCHLAFNRCTLIMRAQGCQIGANVATLSALPPGETLVPVELQEEGDVSPQQTDVPMTVLEKVLQSVVCSECYTNLDDDGFREDHFQPSRGNLLRCSSCPMLCTSECALRAHRRLHAQRRPYVCPECGLRCEEEWNVFHQHVSRYCHHFERIVGYHCQLCPALLLDKAELAGHVVDTHSSALHKCQACPMAFVTLESFQLHRSASHPKLRPQCWLILKCPLCEAVFASSELLATHAQSCHLDQCGRSLFKCATCDSLQPTRADLVAHVRKLHPDMHLQHPWGCREDRKAAVPTTGGTTAKKDYFQTHVPCSTPARDDFRIAVCGGKIQTEAKHKRPAKGEVINLDDDETPEANKAGDGAGPSSSKATQPKRKNPGSPAPSPAAPKSATQKGTPGTLKNAEARQAASNSAKAASSAEKPPEKPPSSAKVCAKCGFESSDASAFRDHIKAHKPANQETFQCPECGLCYVVEPSLRKHLRGVHRVEKAEVKPGVVVVAGSNVEAASDDGLRCSVCLATFDTERELKSHTRSHGMAFLKKVKAKDGTV
ncbi:zinc finger protein 532-like isoform X3 [Haemaphysalis longicornis]